MLEQPLQFGCACRPRGLDTRVLMRGSQDDPEVLQTASAVHIHLSVSAPPGPEPVTFFQVFIEPALPL